MAFHVIVSCALFSDLDGFFMVFSHVLLPLFPNSKKEDVSAITHPDTVTEVRQARISVSSWVIARSRRPRPTRQRTGFGGLADRTWHSTRHRASKRGTMAAFMDVYGIYGLIPDETGHCVRLRKTVTQSGNRISTPNLEVEARPSCILPVPRLIFQCLGAWTDLAG